MRLRQVALVAQELDPVKDVLFRLLGLHADYVDAGVGEFGLKNSVMAIGDTYLEIVAPIAPGTTAERLLERRSGDGGYMVLCQVDDIVRYQEHTEQLNVRKVWEADLPDVKAFHIHPRDIGGAIVSLDEMIPEASWRWAGPDWEQRGARHVGQIIGTTIQAADAPAMLARWADVLMMSPENQRLKMQEGSWIEFVAATDGRGDGVCGITFAGCDLEAVQAQASDLGLDWQEDSVQAGGVELRFLR